MGRWWLGFVGVWGGLLLAGGCSAVGSELEDEAAAGVMGDSSRDDDLDLDGDGDGDGDGFEQCANASDQAKPIEVDMFITVDSSGSMSTDNNWDKARSAFTAFFTDPEADVLNVALRFWPDELCDYSTCSAEICSVPRIPLGSLADPSHESQLVAAFAAKSPYGSTPMYAALEGAAKFGIEHQADKEGLARTIIILMTDGTPNACGSDVAAIAQHAANAYAQAGVLTFVVGLQGTSEATINAIAAAGGTQQGYYIASNNVESGLLQALKDIQTNALACTFAMPESDDPTKPVDPDQVNITFTPPGGTEKTIGQVAGEYACTAAGGWYYDDPADPALIMLCPATCDEVQDKGEGASLNIIMGCATEIL